MSGRVKGAWVGPIIMAMAIIIWSIWLALTPEASTTPPPRPTWHSVGTLISITPLLTSFNESVKSQVETTKGSFIIYGHPSGVYGKEVTLSSNGYLGLAGYQYGFALVATPGRPEELKGSAGG